MNIRLYALSAAALLLAAGCSKQENDNKQGDGTFGQLRITCTPSDKVTVRSATVPAGSAFSLTLSDGSAPLYWATLAAYTTENPLLHYGNYTATVTWGDPATEGVDQAYYAGETQLTINPRQITEVEISAKMVKSMALIRATEQFRTYFQDAHFTLTTDSGNVFDYYFASTAEPAIPDTTNSLYVLAGTSLSIKGSAYKQAPTSDGKRPQVTFAEQKLDKTEATTRYTFEFDAANAGSATLRILLDDTLVETIAIEVELNDDALID